ncbi:MAG: SMC-Scp complex subunit ScpB, partial [Ferruginibacter sp.]
AAEFYAFELKQSGGGWQFLTKPEYHKTVALINGDKFIKKLSTASLETLAIIAYKQPITKSEIESIRGVNCDYAVQKLLEKDLVIISGRNEDAVGKPLIYATSKSFMDYFGINSADELPKISEVLMQEYAKATAISEDGISRSEEEAEEEIPTVMEDVEFVATEEFVEEINPDETPLENINAEEITVEDVVTENEEQDAVEEENKKPEEE